MLFRSESFVSGVDDLLAVSFVFVESVEGGGDGEEPVESFCSFPPVERFRIVTARYETQEVIECDGCRCCREIDTRELIVLPLSQLQLLLDEE